MMQNPYPTKSSSLDPHMQSVFRKHKVVSKTNVHNLICNKCAVVGLMSTLAVYLSVFPATCLVARQVPSLQFSS